MIAKPPLLLLDTNHLVNIREIRAGRGVTQYADEYREFSRLLLTDYVGIVFSAPVSFDWVDGNATTESGKGIAQVIDNCSLRYFCDMDLFIYLYEVLEECKRLWPHLKIPNLPPPLQPIVSKEPIVSALGIVGHEAPNWFDQKDLKGGESSPQQLPAQFPFDSVQRFVKEMTSLRFADPLGYAERVHGYRAALENDMAGIDEYRREPRKWFHNWLTRFLRLDRILIGAGAEPKHLDFSLIEKANCPAVNLWWKAREKRILAVSAPINDNDGDDWQQIAVVPYVDIFLTERNLCHYLRSADVTMSTKVVHNPKEALDRLTAMLAVAI